MVQTVRATQKRGRMVRPDDRRSLLTQEQLRQLNDILRQESVRAESRGEVWNTRSIAEVIKAKFGVNYHPNYIRRVLARVQKALVGESQAIYYKSHNITLYRGNAVDILKMFPEASVSCITTSPPYYGQRDYGVPDQIGLEPHPDQYIKRLVEVFRATRRVLKPTGSLWVNLGDTYWSGKGRPSGPDQKQKNRRFMRPQDRSGPRPLCTPKQLLLIPHRFAIAMQEDGWVVRNDNVWHKVNPTPDPAEDRSASAHEYMFHFVRRRQYYYNFDAVSVPSNGDRATKPVPSVWQIPTATNFKKHIAVFPEALVRIPILATLPPGGVLLDMFCGSGTALGYAVSLGEGRRAIGIDISAPALEEAKELLSKRVRARPTRV